VINLARAARLRPDAILSSRYTRAKQTAEIAAELLRVPKILESRNLLPSAKPAALWAELKNLGDAKQVLLVGHEPHLSNLLAYLTGAGTVEIKKGSLLRVQVSPPPAEPAGVLKWLLPPRIAAKRT
jgi:phosphohistidine phosphatase